MAGDWLGLAGIGWDWLGLAGIGWDWLGLAGLWVGGLGWAAAGQGPDWVGGWLVLLAIYRAGDFVISGRSCFFTILIGFFLFLSVASKGVLLLFYGLVSNEQYISNSRLTFLLLQCPSLAYSPITV